MKTPRAMPARFCIEIVLADVEMLHPRRQSVKSKAGEFVPAEGGKS
jgi:hypothetical protein